MMRVECWAVLWAVVKVVAMVADLVVWMVVELDSGLAVQSAVEWVVKMAALRDLKKVVQLVDKMASWMVGNLV